MLPPPRALLRRRASRASSPLPPPPKAPNTPFPPEAPPTPDTPEAPLAPAPPKALPTPPPNSPPPRPSPPGPPPLAPRAPQVVRPSVLPKVGAVPGANGAPSLACGAVPGGVGGRAVLGTSMGALSYSTSSPYASSLGRRRSHATPPWAPLECAKCHAAAAKWDAPDGAGNHRSSEAITGNQEVIKRSSGAAAAKWDALGSHGNQRSSEVIRGHQRSSEVIKRDALGSHGGRWILPSGSRVVASAFDSSSYLMKEATKAADEGGHQCVSSEALGLGRAAPSRAPSTLRRTKWRRLPTQSDVIRGNQRPSAVISRHQGAYQVEAPPHPIVCFTGRHTGGA